MVGLAAGLVGLVALGIAMRACGPRRPEALLRLRVGTFQNVAAIWTEEPEPETVPVESLRVPDDLAVRFRDWSESYGRRDEGAFDRRGFNAEGRALARELQRHLGPGIAIEYRPIAEGD
jgi:hypothetical protein